MVVQGFEAGSTERGDQYRSRNMAQQPPQAGMFALRERRQHVTQEDFEMAVSKVMKMLSRTEGPWDERRNVQSPTVTDD